MATKICKRCGKEKDISLFPSKYDYKMKKYYISPYCHMCKWDLYQEKEKELREIKMEIRASRRWLGLE